MYLSTICEIDIERFLPILEAYLQLLISVARKGRDVVHAGLLCLGR